MEWALARMHMPMPAMEVMNPEEEDWCLVLPGHGSVGFTVGGVDFDNVALVGQGGLCGEYAVGSGLRGERGDGEVLQGVMLSVREEDRSCEIQVDGYFGSQTDCDAG